MNGKTPQNRNRRSGASFGGSAQEPKIECVSNLPPLIQPGDYQAICYDVQYGIGFGGRKMAYVWFRLIDGEYIDAEVYMACTIYRGLKPRSKLYKQWTTALGRAPKKGDRFSKKVFLNKAFLIRVRSVTTDEHGEPRPEALQYSIVDKIVDPVAGVPWV